MAILWRTCPDRHVACLNLDIDWLTGIEINYNNQKYVILCVYMPYESRDHEDLFLEHLDTLIHGFLPDAMMITIIAPIIKNKEGDLSYNNNYRPIALATIASKLFESLILSRVSTFFIYMCKPIWI